MSSMEQLNFIRQYQGATDSERDNVVQKPATPLKIIPSTLLCQPIAADIDEMNANKRKLKKFSVNVASKNMSVELGKIRKSQNLEMKLLKKSFLLEHLHDTQLISDLGKIRLPRITKSPNIHDSYEMINSDTNEVSTLLTV